MTTLVEAIAVPVITALLGALGIVVRDWRIRRDAQSRRARALADATAQAAFVEQWRRAAEGLGGDPVLREQHAGQARLLLAQAVATVTHSPQLAETPSDRVGATRRLLLLYRLRSGWARVVRAAYLIWLLILVLAYATGVASAFGSTESWASLGYLSIGTLFFLAPAVALRSFALYLDTRRSAAQAS
jgi:hypothetical protein